MAVSDRIAVMNLGEIQQIGTPQAIYQRPANLFVANFIGRSNTLKAKYAGGALRFGNGYTAAYDNLAKASGEDVLVAVRPEEFVITRDGEGIAATVVSSTFLGLNMHYFLKLDDGTDVQVIQEAELDSRLADGEKVRLGVKCNKINIFCKDGSRNLVRGVTNDNVCEQEA